jgi:hypothetical protein
MHIFITTRKLYYILKRYHVYEQYAYLITTSVWESKNKIQWIIYLLQGENDFTKYIKSK